MPTYTDVNSDHGHNKNSLLVNDDLAIRNSIRNILTCPIGSRIFQRDYGSSLSAMLQEPVTRSTAILLGMSLLQSIKRWEPRVKLDAAQSTVIANPDGVSYTINLQYTILATGFTTGLVLNASK